MAPSLLFRERLDELVSVAAKAIADEAPRPAQPPDGKVPETARLASTDDV